MLPELDDIDWTAFEHAYGRADDVPDMLRGMLDPSRTEESFEAFEAAVNHQGWATPAATPCMPWLVAALDEPGAPMARLVTLLAELAIGGSHENWLGRRLDTEAPPELHEPVLAAHETFVGLLDHGEAPLRAAAALALAVLPEAAEAALPALRERIATERTAATKASMLLALGILGSRDDLAAVDEVFKAKKVPAAVATAARCARLWLGPQAIDDDDLIELLAEAQRRRRAQGLPWAAGDVGRIAESAVMWALANHVEAERTLELLEGVDDATAGKVASIIIDKAFPEGGKPVERAEDLDELQRTALMLAAERESLLSGWLGERLQVAQLPVKARGIRVFLGLEQGGQLDREVPLASGSMPLWRAIAAAVRGTLDPAELATVVAEALGTDDTLEAVRELIEEKHHYADVVVISGDTHFSHEDVPLVQRPFARIVSVAAELLRPHGDRFREEAQSQLEPLLEMEHPQGLRSVLWLLVLARCGPLDERWDTLVAKCVQAPPAWRAPLLLSEVLEAIPIERREPIVLSSPLLNWSTSQTRRGDQVIFEWSSAWGGEGWWYLGLCQTPRALQSFVDAIRAWSDLPPVPAPEDVPRGCFANPHAPFPMARAREIFATWDHDFVRAGLEPLLDDRTCDPALVESLLALVDDASKGELPSAG